MLNSYSLNIHEDWIICGGVVCILSYFVTGLKLWMQTDQADFAGRKPFLSSNLTKEINTNP